MPHNPELTPKAHAFPRSIGQVPITKVKDYSYAIQVDLVKHDDPDTMLNGTYDFVKATWSEDGRESERASLEEKQEALRQMLSGKTLQLGLETVNFIFRISGISRIDTHQIVRQRIGVTFSQQCSGDQFWSHHDMLIEPSIYYSQFKGDFIGQALSSKMTYYRMTSDYNSISLQAARSILPHCLETFIFMKVDLATLLLFHRKRIENESQTWQMNYIAYQMERQVCKVFPALTETFERNAKSFKFQQEASKDRANTFSTGLYVPENADFDYHIDDFLYNQTKADLHLTGKRQGLPFKPQYYWGMTSITELAYESIKHKYDMANKLANDERKSLQDCYVYNKNMCKEIGEEIEL